MPDMLADISDLISQGVAAQRRREHEVARALYQRVLDMAPEQPDALHFMGAVLAETGDLRGGIALMQRSAELMPNNALAFTNLAVLQSRAKQWGAALLSAERAIVINPALPAALKARGDALKALRRFGEAIASYEQALRLSPDGIDILVNLGSLLTERGWPERGKAHLDTALRVSPTNEAALINRALAFKLMGRLDEAIGDLTRCLEINPESPDALCSLATVVWAAGDTRDVIPLLEDALSIRPLFPEALTNLGMAFSELGRMEEARLHLERAIEIAPNVPGFRSNLGYFLTLMGEHAAAMASYDAAVRLAPDMHAARFSRGMARLAMGDFAAGWADYEARRTIGDGISAAAKLVVDHVPSVAPVWTGVTPLAGHSILVTSEQGLGDTLQFARFAPLLAAQGAEVVLQVQDGLVRLLRSLHSISQVVPASRAGPSTDYQVPLMSLPHLLGFDIAALPGRPPYLSADPALVSRWQARLRGLPGRKVGLVWAGNPRPEQREVSRVDRRRSIDPSQLSPLGEVPGVTFVSLQKFAPGRARQVPPFPMVDWMDEAEDFADTAALVCTLDLVISVDTSMVHLSGALNKPTWMLNRFDSCWRWLPSAPQGKPDASPWYPELHIIHQSAFGDWTDAVRRCAERLRGLASPRTSLGN